MKHPLYWTPGHIWVSKKPLVTSTPIFQYRYTMDDEEKRHDAVTEEGLLRIADLPALPTSKEDKVDKFSKTRAVMIEDQW